MAETRYAARFRRVVAALRARGFNVVVEDGAYSRTVPGKDLLAVTSDVVHHTAGGNDASDRRVVRDGRTGLRGPLSQFLTHRDGTLRLLATGYANHAGSTLNPSRVGNSRSVGNEIVSAGLRESDFTAAQLRSARALSGELGAEFGYEPRWTRGHKEEGVPLGRKVDPAFSMPAHRAALGAGTTTPAPAPAPTPTPEDWFDMATKAELSEVVNAAIDAHGRHGTFRGLTDDERSVLDGTAGEVATIPSRFLDLKAEVRVVDRRVVQQIQSGLTDERVRAAVAGLGIPAATVDEAAKRLRALVGDVATDETPQVGTR